MAPEEKKTIYWTAGTMLGLVVLVLIVGTFLGWFDTGLTAKP